MEYIIVPGIGGSGPQHWQTLWEQSDPRMRRIQPRSWDQPDLQDWIRALDLAVAQSACPPLLVAHSLGCLLVAHWQKIAPRAVRAALLVAVPDPHSAAFPAEAQMFVDFPRERLRMPSQLIASSNDAYAELTFARRCAQEWGSDLHLIGAAGHINGQSGLGEWTAGRALLAALELSTASR